MSEEKHLVLCHGTMCDDRLFRSQIERFEKEGWRIRVPVMRGYHSGLWGLAMSIMQNLPDRFALVGLSLGASVAMEMVKQAPQRVTHLALLDARDTRFTKEDEEAKDLDHMCAREMGLKSFMEDVMLERYLHKDNLGREDIRKVVVDMALDHGLEVWRGQISLLDGRISYRDVLVDYKGPMLIGCGEADSITPPKFHTELAEARGEKAVIFKGCGHLPVLEDPEAVNSALAELLSK